MFSERAARPFLFGLNIFMEQELADFSPVRQKILNWKKRFPMFRHDVRQIELIVESHIQNYSRLMVEYRQSHKKIYLEKAEKELETIHKTVAIAEKLELMAILSQ